MTKPNAVRIGENRFYLGDCATIAPSVVADESVDLVITDPPYGIGGHTLHKHYNRDERYVVDGYVEVPVGEYGDFSLAWIREAERMLRPGGQMYVVSGYTGLYEILHALRQTSLTEINHIVWKYNFGVYTSRKFVSSHYHVLYYAKPGGKRTFNLESRYGRQESGDEGGSANYQDREDVWIINREYKPGQEKNKNELPQALLMKMIQYSSNPGDVVADLFMGGFSTARAAIGLGRRFVGFEISPQIFHKRVKSIELLEPGFLLGELRQPKITAPRSNEGEPWSPEDYESLFLAYSELCRRGIPKKSIVETLCLRLGRGYWSIQKALKRQSRLRPAVIASEPDARPARCR